MLQECEAPGGRNDRAFTGFGFGAEYQAAFIFSLLVVILVWRNWRLGRQRRYLK